MPQPADLPAPVQLCPAAARWITESAERKALGDFLLALGRDVPRLFKGFQLSAAAIHKAPLRKRFALLLTQDGTLAATVLAECPGPWRDGADLLDRWPADLLHELWRPLTRLQQTPLVPAALTQLSDPSLVARGRRALQRAALWDGGPHFSLASQDRAALAPLQSLLTEASSGRPQQPAAPASPAPSAQGSEQSKADKERRKLRQQLDTLRGESAKKQKALEEKLRLARQTADEQATALQTLKTEQESAVLSRLQQYREEVLGLNPAPPPAAQSEPPPPLEHTPLLNRADRLLDEQARLDEKHGTRARMRKRLNETAERLEQLDAAAANSLAPHPELQQLRRLLQTHAQALEEALGTEDTDVPEPARSFLQSIHAVPADDNAGAALQAILDTLDKPFLRSILGPVWLRELRIAVDKRMEYCAVIEKERVAARATLPSKESQEARGPREIFDLAGELLRNPRKKLQVFIDGYNVLLASGEGDNRALPEERRRLETLCRRHLGDVNLVELVYDGRDSVESRERQGNLLCCFAPRRQQDQNADNWLVAQLEMAAEEEGCRWLVTSDYGLRARAAPYCEAFVTSETFLRFLSMT